VGWKTGIQFLAGAVMGFFSLLPVLGLSHPPIKWVTGTLSPKVKRSRREAHYALSSYAEVKNA
jgi:hypothetical protein